MKSPRLVFLDFDGVLNSQAYYERRDLADKRGLPLSRQENEIDPEAVARLNRVLKETSAKVVVSSSWRKLHTVPQLQRILESRGFDGFILGTTPVINGEHPSGRRYERGDEIECWLTHLGRSDVSFVILDDDSDMGDLYHRWIRTPHETGLMDSHADAAIAMLTRE